MSSSYDRPDYDPDADPCAYTGYDGRAAASGDGSATASASGDDSATAYAEAAAVEGEVPATGEGAEGLERRVWQALYDVRDPEMPISIVDLGLVYRVEVDAEAGHARVDMTLTYTGCPARDMLLGEVERSVGAVDGIERVDLRLVWSPGWTVEMVTEEGRAALREFGLSV